MKKLFCSAAILGLNMLTSITAQAADSVAYDWSGIYLGANVGGAWNNSNWTDGSGRSTPFDPNGSGWVGGGQIGYRQQINNIVLGIEGNLDFASLEGKALCLGTVPNCITKQNFLGSVQANLGFAADKLYVYGTGGIAFTNYDHSEEITLVQKWNTDSRTGWTAGIGAEYAFGNNWSAGVQWNYYDFGSVTVGGGTNPVSVNFKETENVVTARLNFKF